MLPDTLRGVTVPDATLARQLPVAPREVQPLAPSLNVPSVEKEYAAGLQLTVTVDVSPLEIVAGDRDMLQIGGGAISTYTVLLARLLVPQDLLMPVME